MYYASLYTVRKNSQDLLKKGGVLPLSQSLLLFKKGRQSCEGLGEKTGTLLVQRNQVLLHQR